MRNGDLAVTLTVLRSIRGMNQSELAAAAGVTNSAISDYERAKVDPQSQTLYRLLQAMGLPLSTLDQTQEFILRIRAQVEEVTEGPPALAVVARSGSPAPELRELRLEIAQVASEGGRFAARLLHLLLLIFLRPLDRPSE